MAAHTLTNARRLTAKETSTIIRRSLKDSFPATKFSVRTERSGTIRISWMDGPTTQRVEDIAGQFEGKGFDGMIDMAYHIDGWMLDGKIVGTRSRGTEGSMGSVPAWGMIAPHDDCELVDFGAGYIFTYREHSPAFTARLIAAVSKYWGLEAPEVRTSTYDGSGSVNATSEQNREAHARTGFDWGSLVHQASQNRSAFLERHD